MQNYKIITDSAINLPKEIVESLDVVVLPLSFTINNETVSAKDELELKYYYNLMRKGEKVFTSAVCSDQFISAFEEVLLDNKDIFYLGFSSALSATYSNAVTVSNELQNKYPDRKIVCLDSLCACTGQGLLLLDLINKKNSGFDIDQLYQYGLKRRLEVDHIFTVDKLDYLHRGGRVSKGAMIIGNLINLKPILHVDNNGKLVPINKVLGREKSLLSIASIVQKKIIAPNIQTIFISHSDDLDSALRIEAMIRNKIPNIKQIKIAEIDMVIGGHSGPGTIAVFFFTDKR